MSLDSAADWDTDEDNTILPPSQEWLSTSRRSFMSTSKQLDVPTALSPVCTDSSIATNKQLDNPSALSPTSTKGTEAPPLSDKGKLEHPSAWCTKRVCEWVEEGFGETIAKKFKEHDIDGETLIGKRLTIDSCLENLGLSTIGKQERFKKLVIGLKANDLQKEDLSADQSDFQHTDRLLTHKEKRKLSCEMKQEYNTKKKKIVKKIKEQWPMDQPTPSFRSNNLGALKVLDDFVKGIGSKYTLPSCGLGPIAIKQMVLNHMRERRRQIMSASYSASGETTTESEVDSESQSDTSSTNSPISVKKTEYADYFHTELTQNSCDCIMLVFLQKPSIKDVQVVKHLNPLKSLFKLSMLRAQDKQTYIRAIAHALLENGYIKISAKADLKNLRRDEITTIKTIEN